MTVRTSDEFAVVIVPGPVCTDHRARVTARGTYMPTAYRAYMATVRLHALAARPRGWPLDARYSVSITVHEPDRRSRDLDNAAKGALDGMTGALWADDRQIDALSIVRGEVRTALPCVVVTVRRLAADPVQPKKRAKRAAPGAVKPRSAKRAASALTSAGCSLVAGPCDRALARAAKGDE